MVKKMSFSDSKMKKLLKKQKYQIFYMISVIFLFYCTYTALIGFRFLEYDTTPPLTKKNLDSAVYVSSSAAFIIFIMNLALMSTMSSYEDEIMDSGIVWDWWSGSGFYAGIICAVLTILSFLFIRSKLNKLLDEK